MQSICNGALYCLVAAQKKWQIIIQTVELCMDSGVFSNVSVHKNDCETRGESVKMPIALTGWWGHDSGEIFSGSLLNSLAICSMHAWFWWCGGLKFRVHISSTVKLMMSSSQERRRGNREKLFKLVVIWLGLPKGWSGDSTTLHLPGFDEFWVASWGRKWRCIDANAKLTRTVSLWWCGFWLEIFFKKAKGE